MNKYTGENPEFITIEEGPLEDLQEDLQEDMSKEDIDKFNEDFADDGLTPEEKAKRKRIKRIALLVAAGIATGAISTLFIQQAIIDNEDYKRASKLTKSYMTTNSTCLLPDRIFTNQNHDFNYTSGKHLVEAAEAQNASIIRVGDIFITPNGETVVKVTEEVERSYYQPVEIFEVDGHTFYSEPNGYTYDYKTGACVRTETEIVELYKYATDSMHDVEWGTAPYPNSRVIQVLSYEKFNSISYEEARQMKLIGDVSDEHVYSEEVYYNEARLRLVPNNQK